MSKVIPEGWSVQPLGKLADVRSSNVDKKTDDSEQPVRLCNYTDVYYRKRITSEIDFMHATANPREIERFSLEKGDVIITKDSEAPDDIAVPSFVSEQLEGVVCGYHLTLLRPHSSSTYGEYLSYLFQLPSVQHYFYLLANGTTRFGLTADAINNAPLMVPPLPEQQKIATILSSVDNVIEKTRAQIDKLKDLKTSMMQELLTKGIGHTEFKDSPVGRIPTAWNVVLLGEIIGTMDGGVSVNGENRQKNLGELGVLKVSSVFQGAFIPSEHKAVIQEDLNRVKLNPTQDRILFSRANTPQLVGESAYIERTYSDLFLPDKIWMIDVKDKQKTHVKWLAYTLCSGQVRATISNVATGTSGSMRNISKSSLLSIKTALPSLQEQVEITESLQSIDKRLSSTKHKLSGYFSIKKALMQDLLTGKVRVKPSGSIATENV